MYPVKEVYERVCLKENGVLDLAEMWDGGPTEAHLFIRRTGDELILCEEIHHFFSRKTERTEHRLTNRGDLEDIVEEVEAFCKRRYGCVLDIGLRRALGTHEIGNYLGLRYPVF